MLLKIKLHGCMLLNFSPIAALGYNASPNTAIHSNAYPIKCHKEGKTTDFSI